MPRKERDVCTTSSVGDEVLRKPVPPADLWEQMDKIRPIIMSDRPEWSFTISEFAKKYNLAATTARAQIIKLVRIGRLIRIQPSCSRTPAYYRIVK